MNQAAEIRDGSRIIRDCIGIIERSKKLETKISRCDLLIKHATILLKYEQAGIGTTEPPPSELLKIYSRIRNSLHEKRVMPETGLQRDKIDEWRKALLREIENFESMRIVSRIRWLTARDEAVCPLCRSREGKIFTFEEARKELQGEFCRPGDPDDKCRCTFVADENCYSEKAKNRKR